MQIAIIQTEAADFVKINIFVILKTFGHDCRLRIHIFLKIDQVSIPEAYQVKQIFSNDRVTLIARPFINSERYHVPQLIQHISAIIQTL